MTEHTTPNGDLDPAQLERLMEDVARLPREVAPSRDAWPEIRKRIEAQRVRAIAPDAAPAARRGLRPWWIGAAATIVVAAGLWLKFNDRAKSFESAQQPTAPVANGGAVAVPVASVIAAENPPLAAALADYQRATQDLEVEVARQTPNLSPATREVVKRSLAIIDTAIADLNAALGQNPRDAARGQSLSQAYARKVEFLKRVRSLPGTGM